MVPQVNEAFGKFPRSSGKRYFAWKRTSLEYMAAGSLVGTALEPLVLNDDNGCFHYEQKESIVLLG